MYSSLKMRAIFASSLILVCFTGVIPSTNDGKILHSEQKYDQPLRSELNNPSMVHSLPQHNIKQNGAHRVSNEEQHRLQPTNEVPSKPIHGRMDNSQPAQLHGGSFQSSQEHVDFQSNVGTGSEVLQHDAKINPAVVSPHTAIIPEVQSDDIPLQRTLQPVPVNSMSAGDERLPSVNQHNQYTISDTSAHDVLSNHDNRGVLHSSLHASTVVSHNLVQELEPSSHFSDYNMKPNSDSYRKLPAVSTERRGNYQSSSLTANVNENQESFDKHRHYANEHDTAPDIFNEMRHRHDSAQRTHGSPKKSRTDIPHEFQLDDLLFLPSENVNQQGTFSPDKHGNDFVSITVIVTPGVKECLFYSPIADFVIDYQVLRGGVLDLGLFVKDPEGEPIAVRPPSPDATISIKVPSYFHFLPYAICLDNRKASYAEKHVSLTIDLDINWDNPSPQERAALEILQKRSFSSSQIEAMDATYMENWKAVIIQLEALFGRLRRIEHLQQKTDNFASIDNALMESNLSRVTNGSLIQILIMLSVAAVQVLLIRALFDPNSKLYRFWFGKRSPISVRC
ncbi:Nuclear transport factor 2 domain protein [Paragonimus heterotremus]|uniref:Nuclear transport factor 2 domain protein n=1 Tax=Paragonimus heterotremus TaxID=100268 RepID=A0A8J4T599_9TREM|nr:Nuclear transport factor 2 domain protein [Paragonimus heterotremus]